MGDIKQTCDFNQVHRSYLVLDFVAVVKLAEVEEGVVLGLTDTVLVLKVVEVDVEIDVKTVLDKVVETVVVLRDVLVAVVVVVELAEVEVGVVLGHDGDVEVGVDTVLNDAVVEAVVVDVVVLK